MTDIPESMAGMAAEIRRLREQLRVAREALESTHGELAPEGFITRWKNESDAADFAWVRARNRPRPTGPTHGGGRMNSVAIAVNTVEVGTVTAQPCVEVQRAQIGNAVRFDWDGRSWAGRVIDIRPHLNSPDHDILSVAVLGWPVMFSLTRDRGAWASEAPEEPSEVDHG